MARRKKEEVETKAEDKEVEEKVIEESVSDQSVKGTKKTNAAEKETELVPEIVSTETNDGELVPTIFTTEPIKRQTPFGTEVWDPIEKRTVLKNG
ncbi:hypothetical protein JZO73_10300 [Enterococcus plantarum]|uniref:hypothetical protein n=1 Tax=Enterococcus plantarum TaxID=1077675 RepID=UPI001A8F4461|nr:hypothetical protein [Enterococcus plantarum]MBO0467921.1 hypothetical protein [Enterococcus plantarum]